MVDSIDVRWPDGTTSSVRDVKVNQILDIKHP
jgi:ASPIC and UnbV